MGYDAAADKLLERAADCNYAPRSFSAFYEEFVRIPELDLEFARAERAQSHAGIVLDIRFGYHCIYVFFGELECGHAGENFARGERRGLFCQRLALHLFEVRLISANRVAGHVELRRLVGDEQPCILVKEQSEAEAVVPYANLERISEFFRAHGEDIIYVPVGDVSLGVGVAPYFFS